MHRASHPRGSAHGKLESVSEAGNVNEERRAPRFPLRWWDLAVGGTLALTALIGILLGLDPDLDTHWWPLRDAALPTAFGYGLTYVLLGRPALKRRARDEAANLFDSVFLAIQLLIISTAVFADPNFAILQALAYPLIWSVETQRRSAIIWTAACAFAVGAGIFLGLAATGDVRAAFISAGLTMLGSFAFAMAMGLWISRIYDAGEVQRRLAEQLQASQAELTRLSIEAGAAAERERLSRELHDTLTQTLAGLGMLAEQVQGALDRGDLDLARERLARVMEAGREATNEARALVATTQPLGEGGLVASLERVTARLAADSGLTVQLDVDSALNIAPPLPREIEVVFLRAAQEGLANVRKHAQAKTVQVSLDVHERLGTTTVELSIVDDGVGPRPAIGKPSSGFGIEGLRTRAEQVGGRLEFGASPAGGGSRLALSIPLVTEAEGQTT